MTKNLNNGNETKCLCIYYFQNRQVGRSFGKGEVESSSLSSSTTSPSKIEFR